MATVMTFLTGCLYKQDCTCIITTFDISLKTEHVHVNVSKLSFDESFQLSDNPKMRI